jgi:hypothetical protein
MKYLPVHAKVFMYFSVSFRVTNCETPCTSCCCTGRGGKRNVADCHWRVLSPKFVTLATKVMEMLRYWNTRLRREAKIGMGEGDAGK